MTFEDIFIDQVCRQSKGFHDNIWNPTTPFRPIKFNHMISIDHKGPLPRTKSGNRYIMNIMDLFSGYVESIPLPRIGACTTAWNILTKWMFRYRLPESILTDQGSDFTSAIVTKLCKYLGVKKRFSSAYTPQCNGQIERFHKSLSISLRLIVNEKKLAFNEENSPWDLYLPYITAKHNNQFNRTIKMTPNEIVYGSKIRLPHNLELARYQKTNELPKTMKEWLDNLIRVNRKIAAENITKFYEKEKLKQRPSNKPENYQVGDIVVIDEGPTKKTGNNIYDAKIFSGTYRITNIYPSGKTFDL